jgi:cytochrome c556
MMTATVLSSTSMLLLAAFAASAAPAWERQLDMKSMADAAKVIGEMFEDRRPYSQREFRAAAETIRARAGGNLVSAFEGGPQPDSKADTGSISSSAAEFSKLARDLEMYALALSTVADRNPSGLGPETRMGGTLHGSPFARKPDPGRDAAAVPAEHAYHLMLQTCTSCHAKFRKK